MVKRVVVARLGMRGCGSWSREPEGTLQSDERVLAVWRQTRSWHPEFISPPAGIISVVCAFYGELAVPLGGDLGDAQAAPVSPRLSRTLDCLLAGRAI